MATQKGFPLYGATDEYAKAMRAAGIEVVGALDALLGAADLVVDCTPKRVAAKNVELHRTRGITFSLNGREKHTAPGHSYVAASNYARARDRRRPRGVSFHPASPHWATPPLTPTGT